MNLRSITTSTKGWFRRPTEYLSGEWNRMAPRERRLVAGLLGAVGAFAVLVTGYLIFDSLSEIRDSNDAVREALGEIAKRKDEYLDAKSRMVAQEVRIGNEPPQLGADLETAAREAGLQIAETNDRPPQPAGKRYLQHSADVKLRQVDLQSLGKFLSKLETGRRLIVVERLDINRRFAGDGDKMDASLTVTAYERVKEAPKKRAPAGRGTKQ
jgi:type II secretory pathway component PulM